MKTAWVLLWTLALSASSISTRAWNSPGHMLIASIACRELSPDQKKAVANVLAHHPAFEKWAQIYQGGAEDVELGEFLMMKAATWPDEIRRRGGDTAQFDHP